jgi:hypothetical protein
MAHLLQANNGNRRYERRICISERLSRSVTYTSQQLPSMDLCGSPSRDTVVEKEKEKTIQAISLT